MKKTDSPHEMFLISAILAPVLLVSCSDSADEPAPQAHSGKPVVHTTNYPLFYFAQRIGPPPSRSDR